MNKHLLGRRMLGGIFIILGVLDIVDLVKYKCVGTPIGDFCGEEAKGALLIIPFFIIFGLYFIFKKTK